MVLRSKPGLVRQQGEAKGGGECESKGVNFLQPKQACVHKKGARKSQRLEGSGEVACQQRAEEFATVGVQGHT